MTSVNGVPATRRVVLIDDDANYRRLLRYYLQDAGYEVLEGQDGTDALSMVGKDRPHLLVVDIVMPIMEGLETIRLLRRQGTAAKILAISGVEKSHQYLALAVKFGADAAVDKSRPVADLMDTINALISPVGTA